MVENHLIMKKILLVTLLALGQCLYAQLNPNTCENAYSLCGALGAPFANSVNSGAADPASALSFGCLNTQPNAVWFYLSVNQGGNLNFYIEQSEDILFSQNFLDVDFICWGPFSTTDGICGPQNLTPANEVSCSYSTSATENVPIYNAPSDSYYIIMVTNFSNREGYIRITDTNTGNNNAQINCSGIELNAFLDVNGNSIQDDGEVNFPYGDFVYDVNGGTAHNVTNFNGTYSIYDENLTNIYNLSYQLPGQYTGYYSSSATYINVNPQPGSSLITYNFPITVVQSFQDVSVNIIPGFPPVPGFTYAIRIIYTNTGSEVIADGTISFTNDSGYTIESVSEAGAVTSAAGFTFNFSNLLPLETREIEVVMNVPLIPDVALGDEVSCTVVATSANDAVAANNTYVDTQVVVGSYDPNDITESRGREIEITNFNDEDYLYYTIRFQNTGTAPALNARIENLLGNRIDHSTVEMLRASHNFVLEREDNHLTWTFNQIRLPAAETNEVASHGYVYFRVKPAAGYAVGDIIPNSADIYFDFNPAIVTNTFESEFVEVLGAANYNADSFILYPNPAKNAVHIQPAKNSAAILSVKIHDLTGKTIYTSKTSVGEITINTSAFAAGTYFVEVVNSANAKTVKKLIIE